MNVNNNMNANINKSRRANNNYKMNDANNIVMPFFINHTSINEIINAVITKSCIYDTGNIIANNISHSDIIISY